MQSALIILSALISATSAGVGVLSPQDEQNVIQLFHQLCSNGGGGEYEGSTVFCKSARDYQEEVLTHDVHIPQGPGGQAQVVFVSPPPVRYRHNIVLSGAPGSAQSSKIYVLPQKATHQIDATYRPSANPTAAKPMVYFLNRNFGGQQQQQGYGPPGHDLQPEQEVQYGPPLSVVPAPQQPPQYGLVDVSPIPQQPAQEYGYPIQQTHPQVSGGYV